MNSIISNDIANCIYKFLSVDETIIFAKALNNLNQKKIEEQNPRSDNIMLKSNFTNVTNIAIESEIYKIPLWKFQLYVTIVNPIQQVSIEQQITAIPCYIKIILHTIRNWLQILNIVLINSAQNKFWRYDPSWVSCNDMYSNLERVFRLKIQWTSRKYVNYSLIHEQYIKWIETILQCHIPNLNHLYMEVDVTNLPILATISRENKSIVEKILFKKKRLRSLTLCLTAELNNRRSIDYCYIDYNSRQAHENYFSMFLKPFLDIKQSRQLDISILIAMPEGFVPLLNILEQYTLNNIQRFQLELQKLPCTSAAENMRHKYTSNILSSIAQLFDAKLEYISITSALKLKFERSHFNLMT